MPDTAVLAGVLLTASLLNPAPGALGLAAAMGVCRPAEGLRVGIVFGEVAVDGGLEVDEAKEGAVPQPALGQGGEEAFDRVNQEALVGVKWKVTRGCRAS